MPLTMGLSYYPPLSTNEPKFNYPPLSTNEPTWRNTMHVSNISKEHNEAIKAEANRKIESTNSKLTPVVRPYTGIPRAAMNGNG
jgi:hypothetical protein